MKKTLKIDQILKPKSAYSIGRTHQTKGSKAEEALIAKKIKAVSDGKTTTAKRNSSKTAALYDAWGDEETNTIAESSKKSKFVPIIPAVPVPETFISYNPSREEHLARLESLESQEVTRLERSEAFKKTLPLNVVSEEFVGSEDLVAVANRKLATGEFSEDEDDSEEDKGETYLSGSTQANRKKTIQQLKKKQRHKELMAEYQSKRQEKTLLSSIDRVPDLLSHIQTVQQTRRDAEQLLAPLEQDIRKERQLKKIKKRLVMEPLAIKLPEELPTSMRQLAPEGNLVTDRFRNLIERGAIEATTHKILSAETKAMNRSKGKSVKPRIKMVEKFSYKDFK